VATANVSQVHELNEAATTVVQRRGLTRILVVDDEQSVLESYHHILVDAYDLTLCNRADQAVEAVCAANAEGSPFSVAFVDVRMPEHNGVWAAERIRELDPHIQIVIVTGYSDVAPEDIADRVPPADALLYIQKPFHAAEVRQFAQALAAKWHAERVSQQALLELQAVNDQLERDITARKQAEEALRESEERFRVLFDSAVDAIFLADPRTGMLLDVNQAAEALTGHTRPELLQMHQGQLHPPDKPEHYQQMFAQHVEQGRAAEFEAEVIRQDGSIVPVYISAAVIDIGGRSVIQGRFVDITARKRAEEQLRREKERAQNYLDIAGTMIAAIDADEKITLINREGCEILGYQHEELLGQNWFDLLVPEAIRDEVRGVFKKLMAGDVEPVKHYENPLLTKDGEQRIVAFHNTIITDSQDRIVGVLLSGNDITARKQAEEKLRESEERYRSLIDDVLDSSSVGLFILDADFKVVWINRALERYFGVSRQQIIGQDKRKLIRENIKNIFEDPDCFARTVFAAYDDNTYVENFECHVLGGDNREERWLKHWSQPIRSGPYAGGRIEHYTDITDRKRAEQERILLEQQLFQAQKLEALGTLAGGVAHDFNNLLTGMIGMTELALRHLEPGTKAYEWLANVPEQGKRAGELIASLMAFGRRTVTDPRPLALVPLVKEIGKMLTRTMPENITVRTAWPEQVPLVRADPTQMQQIIMNLATNARDAMPDGGELTIQVSEACLDEHYCRSYADATPGDYVCLSVRDTGTGIPPEVREHIFEPFFTTKDAGDGTGLGLAMVYGIVKNHDGHVHFYSEVGRGTEFKIYLPVVERETLAEEKGTPGNLPEGTETLLLVEDDAIVLGVGQEILESLGYTVLTAADGEEGLDIYRAHHDEIALVLTDHTMPNMNGDKLYEAMVQIDPAVKVLVTSGYACDQEVSGLRARGLQGFVQKPFNSEDLGRAVRQALD